MNVMDTAEVIRAYVDGECSLGDLHGRLQELTWGRPLDDALAGDARRLIGEATSADWAEGELREELSHLLGRREDANRIQEALKGAVAHLDKAYLVVASDQASASQWSVEVLTDRHEWITTAKTRDQTETVRPG
jgi:hypothetical protein